MDLDDDDDVAAQIIVPREHIICGMALCVGNLLQDETNQGQLLQFFADAGFSMSPDGDFDLKLTSMMKTLDSKQMLPALNRLLNKLEDANALKLAQEVMKDRERHDRALAVIHRILNSVK